MKYNLENKTNLIVGSIDSGKTRGMLFNEVNEIIQRNENFMVIDSKEEYYKTYGETLKNNGYKTIVINLANPQNSNCYNPFTLVNNYYKKNEIDKSIDLIEKMGLELYKTDGQGDPFWSNSASDLFIGLSLILLKESKNEEEINIGSVNILMDLLRKEYKSNNLIKLYLDTLNPYDPIYTSAGATVYAPSETRGGIISVAKQIIKSFCIRPTLMNMLGKTDFDIENLSEKIAIFVIPVKGNSGINNMANILMEQLLYSCDRNEVKFNFILDNIESLSKINDLKDYINFGNNNIKITIATRNIEELENIYDKTTFNNIVNKIRVTEKVNFDIKNAIDYEYPHNSNITKYFNAEEYMINKLKDRSIVVDQLLKKIDDKIEQLEKEENKDK